MRRFERTDDFLTIFEEDVAEARRARRRRWRAMLRDFCALSAVSAFGMTVPVWAAALTERPVEFRIAASLSTDRGFAETHLAAPSDFRIVSEDAR